MEKSSQVWPADKIERRSVETLISYARNSRTHSAEQVDQLVASIKEWGFTTPVLVSEDGTIIAGHGRVMAAKKVGLDTIPVMVARGWSEAQRKAYVLADNKLALNAGWDLDMLKIEIGDLQDMGFDLNLLGFDGEELALMLDEPDGAGDGEGDGSSESGAGSLSERFGLPPFTVLNARDGWWQERKRAWLSLGIRSELGRGEVSNG